MTVATGECTWLHEDVVARRRVWLQGEWPSADAHGRGWWSHAGACDHKSNGCVRACAAVEIPSPRQRSGDDSEEVTNGFLVESNGEEPGLAPTRRLIQGRGKVAPRG